MFKSMFVKVHVYEKRLNEQNSELLCFVCITSNSFTTAKLSSGVVERAEMCESAHIVKQDAFTTLKQP